MYFTNKRNMSREQQKRVLSWFLFGVLRIRNENDVGHQHFCTDLNGKIGCVCTWRILLFTTSYLEFSGKRSILSQPPCGPRAFITPNSNMAHSVYFQTILNCLVSKSTAISVFH